eukprot:7745400-Pyramimonas_sp.AAC.1
MVPTIEARSGRRARSAGTQRSATANTSPAPSRAGRRTMRGAPTWPREALRWLLRASSCSLPRAR